MEALGADVMKAQSAHGMDSKAHMVALCAFNMIATNAITNVSTECSMHAIPHDQSTLLYYQSTLLQPNNMNMVIMAHIFSFIAAIASGDQISWRIFTNSGGIASPDMVALCIHGVPTIGQWPKYDFWYWI